jgi:hypothetical protein
LGFFFVFCFAYLSLALVADGPSVAPHFVLGGHFFFLVSFFGLVADGPSEMCEFFFFPSGAASRWILGDAASKASKAASKASKADSEGGKAASRANFSGDRLCVVGQAAVKAVVKAVVRQQSEGSYMSSNIELYEL